MNKLERSGLTGARLVSALVAVVMVAFASREGVAAPATATSALAQAGSERPRLVARVSRWEGDPVKKVQGPEGFDLQFRLVGGRFDGTFQLEGLPQNVPEGAPFDVQLKLFNIGEKKEIKVSSILVVGDGMMLITNLMETKVDPKSAETVASFRVPPQSSAGSTFLITVILSNGDKHVATLSFAPPDQK